MLLILASQGFVAIERLVGIEPSVRRVAFVPTAANRLAEGRAIVAMFEDDLARAGLDAIDCDLDRVDPGRAAEGIGAADALFVTGGDPFYLMRRLRETGCDRHVALAAARVPYAGASAGAVVAGPSLEPLAASSPFPKHPGMDMTALGLTRHVVLPHHGRPDRVAEHEIIQRTFGHAFAVVPLRDVEALIVRDGEGRVVRG